MLLWIILLVVIVWAIWNFTRRGVGPNVGGGDRAEQLLRERYARGEIDTETFHRMLEELRRQPP